MMLRRILIGCLMAALGIFSSMSSHAQLLPPPILTCNGQSTTPSVIYPSQLRETLNTYAAGRVENGYTYVNDNQRRWEIGTEILAKPADGTTGVLSPASPNGYNAPPTIPSLASGWIPLGNFATNGLNADYMVGLDGNFKPNMNPNVMYYVRFQFMMDPMADPSQFGLWFSNVDGDDRVKGVYVNGQRVRTTGNANDLYAGLADTSLAPSDTHFQAGLNEIVWAVLNIGDPTNPPSYNAQFNNPSITGLRIGNAFVNDCTPQPTITPPAVPPGILTPTTVMSYTGTVTQWGAATTVSVYVANSVTSQLYGPYTANIDPITGAYSALNAPSLPTGTYITIAMITVPPPTPEGQAVTVQSVLNSFVVIGLTMTPPPNIDDATIQTISGTVQNPGVATTVNITLTNTATSQTSGPYAATIQPDGSYSVPTELLPAGNYTATATIPGAAGVQATGNFVVTALPVTSITVTPPPTLTPEEKPIINGTVTNPGSATTVVITIVNPTNNQSYGPFTVPIAPDGTYTVTTDALPPGSYNVTATANGKSATGSFKVIAPVVPQAVTPVPMVSGWVAWPLSALLAALGLPWLRRRKPRS
ncbi:hypothetical protein G7048_18650 [Diaphorobacter sp. HDW4B]|uniref:hypothetical protein n=1 Tax=Diaphorobacter sp. HDW4B TaxID=2714925 RepID=UPI001408BBD8|nr:hypothetical protein [Diaphorobacter sp. HDW4B]QIL72204.1 hypothetical protein G7048_18650 [Diaphorobacter sp. HDW4B]